MVSAWNDFEEEMQSLGYSLDVDILFPKPPPDDQNFATIPFLKRLVAHPEEFVGVMEVASTLKREHPTYVPENMPEGSWRNGYGWTPEDVRLILLSRGAVATPEPPLNAQGNLAFFGYFDSYFQELKPALDRTFCQFPIFFELGPQHPYAHQETLYEIILLLSARSVTYLHLGRSQDALEDLVFAWSLIHKLDTDRTIMASLVGESCFLYSLQPLWQGIATHQWSPEQLEEIQGKLERFQFIKSFKRNYLFETVWIARLYATIEAAWMQSFVGSLMEKGGVIFNKEIPGLETAMSYLFSKIPLGWIRLNLIHTTESAFDYAQATFQEDKHLIDPSVVKKKMLDFDVLYNSTLNPDRFFVPRFKEALFNNQTPRMAAQGQSYADMAWIACWLERFYKANSKYPESLEEALKAAKDIAKDAVFPMDVISGEPYAYLRSSSSFSLYSMAWDKLNNLGQIGETFSGMEDWVWPAADHPAVNDPLF